MERHEGADIVEKLCLVPAARGVVMRVIQGRFIELQGSAPILAGVPNVLRTTSITLLITAPLASLYFMWTVRHPKIA